MKIRIIILTVLFIYQIGFSQEPKSIHQIEWEKHKNDAKVLRKPGSAKDIIPLNKVAFEEKALSHYVFGYLPYWVYNSPPLDFQFDLLTHIALFDFSVDHVTGAIGNPSNWPWTDLIDAAHTNGVKVIMCVVEFDNDKIHKIITDQTVKENFFAKVKSKIETYNLDGVNIDFEGLHQQDRANNINPFMAELTDYVHTNIGSDKEVSFAGPAVNWGGWNFPGLAVACDYLFIMGYDFNGSWSANAGPSAPLIGGSYNITRTLTDNDKGYANVVNTMPEKLILGVPYYGNKWRTSSMSQEATALEHLDHPFYYEATRDLGSHNLLWSSTYRTPWYTYESGGKYYQTWFDNDSSLGLKYDLAKSKNLKGVGMWALGYDKHHPELWNVLRDKFYSDDLDTSDITDKPEKFKLYQNYPNPFNPGTTIKYIIPSVATHSDASLQTTLKIYDILGNEVATLVNEMQSPGEYFVKFNVETQNLASLPNGIYFYRLRVGDYSAGSEQDNIKTKKMLLLR